jgi:hypothetical protein
MVEPIVRSGLTAEQVKDVQSFHVGEHVEVIPEPGDLFTVKISIPDPVPVPAAGSESGQERNLWPKDNQDSLIAFYGDPGMKACESQLVPVVPPFRMTYEGQPIESIKFHKKAAGALLAALNEIWEAYGKDQSKIDAAGISRYDGAYNPRFIRGSTTKWSNHAYGAAIDINAKDNGFNTGHGTMPKIVVDAFKRQGARWGGDYHHRTDPMHFEFCDAGETAIDPEEQSDSVPDPQVRPHPELRLRMAKAIMDFEARRDKQGHLVVYNLPANDGGGRYEVAGINEKYDKPVCDQLVSLVNAGRFDEAENVAEEYIASNTDPAARLTTIPSIESYLRDCVFNRGPTGAIKILQLALGFEGTKAVPGDVDGDWGANSQTAMAEAQKAPQDLLEKLRAARERYEREWIGFRANLWDGLVNRWNGALKIARTFPDRAD